MAIAFQRRIHSEVRGISQEVARPRLVAIAFQRRTHSDFYNDAVNEREIKSQSPSSGALIRTADQLPVVRGNRGEHVAIAFQQHTHSAYPMYSDNGYMWDYSGSQSPSSGALIRDRP